MADVTKTIEYEFDVKTGKGFDEAIAKAGAINEAYTSALENLRQEIAKVGENGIDLGKIKPLDVKPVSDSLKSIVNNEAFEAFKRQAQDMGVKAQEAFERATIKSRALREEIARLNSQGFKVDSAPVRALQEELAKTERSLETMTKGSKGAFGNIGQQVQNASFQITDFITQVQGGTSAMRALSQQLPQLLGAFGAWGAAAGVVAAVLPAIWKGVTGGGDSVEALKKKVNDLNTGMSDLASGAKRIDMSHLREELFSTSNAARETASTILGIEKRLAELSVQKATKVMYEDTMRTHDGLGKIFQDFEKNNGVVVKSTADYKTLWEQLRTDPVGMQKFVDYAEKYAGKSEKTTQALKKFQEGIKGVNDANANLNIGKLDVSTRDLSERNKQIELSLKGQVSQQAELVRQASQRYDAALKDASVTTVQRDMLRENLRLETERYKDMVAHSSDYKSTVAAEKKAQRDAAAEAKKLAAEQKQLLDQLYSGQMTDGSKLDKLQERLVKLVQLRGNMAKAGMKEAGGAMIEDQIAKAIDAIDVEKQKEYIAGLQGYTKGAVEASQALDKMSASAKLTDDEMQGRMATARNWAAQQADSTKALAEAMKALQIPDSYMSGMEKLNLNLEKQDETVARNRETIEALTEKYQSGVMSAEDYAEALRKINDTQVMMAEGDMTGYWQGTIDKMDSAKQKTEELQASFAKFSADHDLTSAQIDKVMEKFPELQDEGYKAMKSLKKSVMDIGVDKLGEALEGNVKDWRKWGAETLKMISEVLIKWALLRAAQAAMGGGGFMGMAGGGTSGAMAPAAPAVANYRTYNQISLGRPGASTGALLAGVTTGAGVGGASSTAGNGGGTKIEINNYNNSQIETERSTDENGLERIRIMIRDEVKTGMGNGSYDSAMRQNYGISRRAL